MKKEIKFKVGRYLIPVVLNYVDDRIFVSFKYNKSLIAEIKAMAGAKWHGFDEPPRKIWSISNSPRNAFQIAYLQNKNPYVHYDLPIVKQDYSRPLYSHQKDIADFMLTRHYCLIAADCGVGKTLAAIETMERSLAKSFWYIAPKSALYAVKREFIRWDFNIKVNMLTYERLVRIMKSWTNDSKAPQFVVFDESSRVKNSTAQRSQAALALANGVREDWGDSGFVILMSGTPAPKSPVDFWHQLEIACPGFIREGSQNQFKKRLAIIVNKERFEGGGAYPSIVSWLDDSKKCAVCGELEEAIIHKNVDDDYHAFKPSVNEVELLYKRMTGLVDIKLKSNCLDLPDKIYRIIKLEPTQQISQVAKTIVDTAPTTIAGLTLLRELSDGFQYRDEPTGEETCPVCFGKKQLPDPLNPKELATCDGCGGLGTRKKYKRITIQVPSPKEDALRELLDFYSEVGRVVIYGGFTGSIDRVINICTDMKWETIRVDGRGWESSLSDDEHLDNFQDELIAFPRVAFVAQPSSGGFGITLTSSPVIIYYSNDFNAESREQSEERIHRIGMDKNWGATIIDLVHLQTDQLILDNLKKKRRLQAIALNDVKGVLKYEKM